MRELERVTARTRAEWRRWLEANHGQVESIWLITFKKASGQPHLPYGDIVDEALCFGWIDSRPAKLDENRSMLLLSPRRRGSAWSKINKDKVARLTAEGRMSPAGLAKVEEAKRDGRWQALDEVETLALPDDLLAGLRDAPEALENFEAFPPSVRRGILEWIATAKRADTRARRIGETARLATQNIRANYPVQAGRTRPRGASPR